MTVIKEHQRQQHIRSLPSGETVLVRACTVHEHEADFENDAEKQEHKSLADKMLELSEATNLKTDPEKAEAAAESVFKDILSIINHKIKIAASYGKYYIEISLIDYSPYAYNYEMKSKIINFFKKRGFIITGSPYSTYTIVISWKEGELPPPRTQEKWKSWGKSNNQPKENKVWKFNK